MLSRIESNKATIAPFNNEWATWMNPVIPGLLAVLIYLAGTVYQFLVFKGYRNRDNSRQALSAIGLAALLAHFVNIYLLICSGDEINLSFFNMASLITAFITAITVATVISKPIDNLLIILFPLSALSIVGSAVFADGANPHVDITSGVLTHILVSVLAYAVITIATIQATALRFQEFQLKHKHTVGIIDFMPPLQTMEALLFQMIWIGIILLSLSILSGILYLEDIFAQHLMHKTLFSIFAWCTFAVLLWGRHKLGWRSSTAVAWTFGGFIFLMLGYFGSKFVLEIVLQRV
jgi:ABC-type uncharacterized transport system permease subunit